MSGTSSPEAVKKLLENMQSDLRALSLECKKKFPPVKEAAESGIIKVKTIAARNTEILAALKENSSEVVQPFLMGCGTKEPKITQLCLAAIQRLMSHEVVSETAAGNIINMLWQLMENSLEELKLLQTVLVLLTTNTVVHDEALSKAIVLCFRLHFTKDNITNNTAAATVRQVVTVVFERMVAEDERHRDIIEQPILVQGNSNRRSVSTLKPCAKDAYMLFQDLCQLVNADAPYWLVGMTEMTRTFGLELLESVLNDFPQVFLQHQEFSFLLKERVCPLVIKLFSPNIKFRQGSSTSSSPAPVEKPYFPICMRLLRVVSVLIKQFYSLLVTECEIFLSLLVKFLDADKPQWLRAVAVESIHRFCVQPQLLRSFCQSYDMKQHSTKVFRDIVNALGSFIQSLFLVPPTGNPATSNQAGNNNLGGSVSAPANSGMVGIGGGVTLLPAFEYRGTWIPILTITVQGSAKATYLEMLDKVEPPTIPEGYAMSVAFHCLLDLVRGITSMIEGELGEVETECQTTTEEASSPTQSSEQQDLQSTSDQMDKEIVSRAVWEEMVNACWCGLLAALSLLLDASTDEAATENILKAELTMAALCGRLGLVTSRDAFITAICKGSLPPHYALTVLNTTTAATLSNKSYSVQGQSVMMISPSSESHQQVVAVGQPLAVQPQGTVMLTSKNIQCMRTLLNLAHCHGAVLGTSWQLVLATLQHLVWILGLKPSSGGALKPGRAVEGPSTVLTTAVMTDLPVISNILSRLFESSQYLDDVSLHHLINALCSLSLEAMDMAYGNNKEPSLFAVAKLLETGLVNMHRIEILWRPLTGHLLEVCQHPNSRMREWGAEALTSLIKAGLTFNHDPPLSQNQRLQLLLLNPLKEMSNINHPDIRLKQLECVLQILQSQGDSLGPGWPLVLGVMGAIRNDQGESLIRTAFQCLQLVVTDFLPTMPCTCLQIVVDVAGSFGLHNQELNISLTSIGLLWNISDYFFQRGETIEKELNKEEAAQQKQAEEKGVVLNRPFHPAPPFDCLWLCLYAKLGELCVDPRPAVRKSAGQTLFSTIGAHGTLLQHSTWHTVIWKVLFHLLDRVRESSTTADKEKIESGGGNILIHHSRDTAEKQWAETWVLTLAGVARIFNTRRYLLQPLGDFSRAWDVLLDHIQSAALSKNNEVSLAALKSFQEILQIVSPVRDSDKPETPPVVNVPVPVLIGPISGMSRPFVRTDSIGERLGRYSSSEPPIVTDELEDLNLWWAAWNTWYRIGSESTKPPVTFDKLTFIPSQPFLTALIQIFPALYQHIKTGFNMDDLQKLGVILHSAISVPISSDASPFILPSYTEAVLTSLQEAVLTALDVLQKAICVGPENMQIMYPAIFDQLLAFVEFSCKPPQYGQLETKHIANAKYNQIQLFAPAEWVALNYVPFAERSLEVVVDLYQKTACHKAVVNEKVLQYIIKTLRVPLSLKYSCPSESTWKLAVSSLLKVLSIGLPVARQHASSGKFDSMWPELANTFEDFLFTKSIPPDNLSIQEFQRNENIDVEVVQLISNEILPYANFIPKEFVGQIMTMLNKGSIHSQSSSFTEAEIDIRLREEFSKMCFETLLQFSFSNKVTTPQEGYISRMALSVLLKRSQDVLHRYIEDERLSGKCPLPRQQVTEIIFVLKAVSTLIDSLKKTQPENVDGNTWAQVIALYPTLVECITCSSSEVCSALKEALVPFKDFMQPPASRVQNGES
ncbi:protein MON2 homolog isoform X1 [Macaca nemestrina]|uniref:Protein MON2 homolog n=5 Tax=Cercopithecidae TaxID=9527 RepID=A0A2K5L7G8_CERAT|nr:protein MON2 homolog isoform X2 [Papio anubis]XP_005571479.1 protein MON2 homolog isoform X6 [Macaca fascicularis]XP_011726647.1 protein MON2 homolog isoform X2 [Macaca nemestrina]XP_011828311.1 PREDICTED: protein MON2 homolog isoform X2 [Mandrillus leucophaeus]XP_011947294.1 PREDICTED: protein MON2 homolog isoform X2 [Cercocebus atys]XP_023080870.1 protein MON2 homolog isoform X1 [Piliocolobus tephrosceles]XP_025258297.1 protein MON2 homolog isoform X2 [Theropithecus gelada]XP_050604354.